MERLDKTNKNKYKAGDSEKEFLESLAEFEATLKAKKRKNLSEDNRRD